MVVKTEESSLTPMNLVGLGKNGTVVHHYCYFCRVNHLFLAMINERQREFGAMRALGANLTHLRRFLFAEAATICGLI